MKKMNSSIVRKHCKCGCQKWPTLSCFGYNFGCLPPNLKEKAGTKRKISIKNRNKRVALSKKLHIAQKSTDESEYANKLSLWFKYQMQVSKKVCENCGADLSHYNENDWFSSHHHIIEKSLCGSVASHPQNHIVLGKWCCHSQVHTSWLNLSKMHCYEEMKKRFNMFRGDISEKELSKLHKHPFLTT